MQKEPQGCLMSILNTIVQGVLRLLGMGGQAMRKTMIPPDEQYQAYVDLWVSERLANWLNQTRPDIDAKTATGILMGKNRNSEATKLIRETLVDAKVTFSQQNGAQYMEVEAYMAPRQVNGTVPKLDRWRAQREIAWQDIPNNVRERLIRYREPVTLVYAIPEA
jgi:hypothetical protein